MPKKNLGGRPLKVIDQTQFEKLCAMQCTLAEISAFFDVSEDTIERWCRRTYNARFADVYAQKRQQGVISLRRTMWQRATTKQDTALIIFMAKNYLGMSDTARIDIGEDTLKKAKDILSNIDTVID